MSTIRIEIVSPEKVLLSRKDVESVVLPGSGGSLGVLPHHAPLITSLKEGVIEYRTASEKGSLQIMGGFAEVADNKLIVLVTLPDGGEAD